ncbi:MAG: heavy-metal-associated domain-containing protein [Rubrivivax sp.]
MITFSVNDMTCGHCVGSITSAVKAVDPQAQVHADVATHQVQIQTTQASAAQLGDAIRDAGYTPVAVASAAAPATAASPRKGCCCG